MAEAEFIAWLDDPQIQWVRAAGRLSPALVVELLGWAGPRLVETFRGEDPRSPTAHVSWAGNDRVPVWLDQLCNLSEYQIHRQQLHQDSAFPATCAPISPSHPPSAVLGVPVPSRPGSQ